MSDIVLLNASFAPSLILFREPMIREMIQRGYSVHATAPEFDTPTATRLALLGVGMTTIAMARRGLSAGGDMRYFAGMRKLIRRLRPRLVLNYTVKPNIWGSLAAAAAGAPSVSMITGAGFVLMTGGTLAERASRFIAQRLYRVALGANARVVFQNDDDVAEFAAVGALRDRAKVLRVNGSGVDVDWFAPAPLPSAPVFLLIARLLATKGVREFVAASKLVRAEVPEARFVLAGPLDPGYDGVAGEELAEWQASGVDYLGALPDVRPALRAASVYVLPSYREGTPRSVLEAMAMGRPVVTTDVPGCRETVIDGRNGLLVPARSVEPLAQAMLKLARDPALRERMGSQGRQMVLERFDVHKVNAVLLDGIGLTPLTSEAR